MMPAARARTATPPTVPPTMAPTGVEEPPESGAGVGGIVVEELVDVEVEDVEGGGVVVVGGAVLDVWSVMCA